MLPYDKFISTKYFISLDALRCFGILGVIWQHTPEIALKIPVFTDAGASGVALFFALSGFLITTLLLREQSETGTINLKNFYARRSLRIFPLYYTVLALYTILVVLLEKNAAGRLFINNLPYYFTYTNNWFVDLKLNEDGQRRVIFIFAWTLATEEQFYFLWPAALKFFRRNIAITLLIFIMTLDIVLSFIFGKAEVPNSINERFLRIATSPSTEIFFGVLLAITLHCKTGFNVFWRYLGHQWASPITASIALIICILPRHSSESWYLAQSAIFTLLIATCIIREDHGLSKILRFRLFVRIGVISYGMYLLHMLAVNSTKVFFSKIEIDNPIIFFSAALILTYLAAECSYRFFETPILRYKKRFLSFPQKI